MLKQIFLAAIATVLMMSVRPSEVNAYGAAHVGYTHVGPNGVYHTGTTVASGPHGTYEGSHTTAAGYGGAEYHGASSGAEYHGASYGAAGGYRYTPSYYGGAAAGGAKVGYAYVR
jgi:hypothetical protein